MSYPLLTNPSGTKFGKTAAGTAVWLDPARTSPYAFYQYWLDADDRDVGKYLRTFTLLDRDRIEDLEAAQASHPEDRLAQRALALDVTTRVHGEDEARRAIRVSEAAFARTPLRDPALLDELYVSLEHFDFGPEDLESGALRLAVAGGMYASNGEARRAISQGGLSINDVRVKTPEDVVPAPIDGRYLVLRAGKKSLKIGRRRI